MSLSNRYTARVNTLLIQRKLGLLNVMLTSNERSAYLGILILPNHTLHPSYLEDIMEILYFPRIPKLFRSSLSDWRGQGVQQMEIQ